MKTYIAIFFLVGCQITLENPSAMYSPYAAIGFFTMVSILMHVVLYVYIKRVMNDN